eukprot:6079498-Amphidinium_carterae.1
MAETFLRCPVLIVHVAKDETVERHHGKNNDRNSFVVCIIFVLRLSSEIKVSNLVLKILWIWIITTKGQQAYSGNQSRKKTHMMVQLLCDAYIACRLLDSRVARHASARLEGQCALRSKRECLHQAASFA